jgi:hypothetical protein
MEDTLTPAVKNKLPWKLLCITIFSIFIIGCYTSISLYNSAVSEYQGRRTEFLMSQIESDLSKRPIAIDLKDSRKLQAKVASKDDLLKMLWVYNVRLTQCSQSIDGIRDVVGLPQQQTMEQ